MATSDPTGSFRRAMAYELAGLQQDMNRAREQQMEWLRLHPLPPLTRWQKMKRRVSSRQHAVRTRVALLVAPWLDDY